MRILTTENQTMDLAILPELIENDLRYCVLDYSNQQDVDFVFPPVVFIDQFTRPAADLRIGNYHVQVPLDWSVVIADKNMGSMELIDIKHINDRDFQVFCFNPISGYMPSFPDIEIENIFPDVSWSVPKLDNGHILAVPITMGREPLCALFVKDTNKLPDCLDITKIIH
jgi:hypothetical protein